MTEDTHVSIHAVRRVLRQVPSLIRVHPPYQLPKNILLDEFKSIKSIDAAMSFIWSDVLSYKLIDVLDVRRQVKTATTDMFEPYMDIIPRCFSKTEIIIEPFHIIQALKRELNRYRVQNMNSVRNTNHRLYNKLKCYWKQIVKNPSKLQATTYDLFRLFVD